MHFNLKGLEAAELELSDVLKDWHYVMPTDGIDRVIRAYLSASIPAGLDAVDMDMIQRGDRLGPELGARVASALLSLSAELETVKGERDEARRSNREARAVISATHKRAVTHQNCQRHSCPICEGGLFQCADCGAAEIETEQRVCTGPAAEAKLAGGEVTEASDYVQGDDGFWFFWPTTNKGAYSASVLRNIADKLDHNNAEWKSHLEAASTGRGIMSARDVIASKTGAIDPALGRLRADDILQALTAAGWRLVGPDEVDPVTVEKCASVCDAIAETMYGHDRFLKPAGMSQVASAIRAIASGGKQ